MQVTTAVQLRIIQLCLERDWTTTILADKAGVPMSTMRALMNRNTRTVSLRTLGKLCNGLGISSREFFNDDLFDHVQWQDD